jgi:glycosyltransferase involved in cell wall biosynthesis
VPEALPVPGSRTTLVDARWIGKLGTTTFSRSLLQGLAEVRPPGNWLLWGPPEMTDVHWPEAVRLPTTVDPTAWFGQRSLLRVPRADLVLHPHQTRPLHRMPAASCVLDLIQLRHPVALVREAKALRLRLSVRAARALFTISASVRDQLASEFDVDPSAVTVLRLPVDEAAAARVAARRATGPRGRYLLSLGRFFPHKNLRRLIQAFSGTRFASSGGELHLAGGEREQLDLGADGLPPGVRVLGVLPQPDLEDAMAGALALVQASLEEGYGLPVAEALVAGIPVATSPIPAVTEGGPAGVPTFDPRSVPDIAEAIDETVRLVEEGRYWDVVARDAWLARRPTARTLAEQVLGGLDAIDGAPS